MKEQSMRGFERTVWTLALLVILLVSVVTHIEKTEQIQNLKTENQHLQFTNDELQNIMINQTDELWSLKYQLEKDTSQ